MRPITFINVALYYTEHTKWLIVYTITVRTLKINSRIRSSTILPQRLFISLTFYDYFTQTTPERFRRSEK